MRRTSIAYCRGQKRHESVDWNIDPRYVAQQVQQRQQQTQKQPWYHGGGGGDFDQQDRQIARQLQHRQHLASWSVSNSRRRHRHSSAVDLMIRDTVSDQGDASSLLPNDGDDFVIKELDDEPGALSGDNVNSAAATSRTRGTTGRLTKALLLTNMVGIVDRRQRKEERRRQRRREQTRRQRSDQSAVSGAGADGAAAAAAVIGDDSAAPNPYDHDDYDAAAAAAAEAGGGGAGGSVGAVSVEALSAARPVLLRSVVGLVDEVCHALARHTNAFLENVAGLVDLVVTNGTKAPFNNLTSSFSSLSSSINHSSSSKSHPLSAALMSSTRPAPNSSRGGGGNNVNSEGFDRVGVVSVLQSFQVFLRQVFAVRLLRE